MTRRACLTLLGGAAVTWPGAVLAQPPATIARLGVLSGGAPVTNTSPVGAALLRGLAQHGPTLGRNVALERRGAEGHSDRLPQRVFAFAATQRLPAIYEFDYLVRDGGLMSYGPDLDESFSRVAALVDRIRKGAKPADLPFEQPTRFRLVINLKTAQAMGLSVPALLLFQADEVLK